MGKKETGPANSPETPAPIAPPINVTPADPAPPPPPADAEKEPESGEKRTVHFWAHRAGHVPKDTARALALRGQIHRGRHWEVVMTHAQAHHLPAFARNAMVTKEEYDACADAAYGIVCRENWSEEERQKLEAEQAERLAAREKKEA